MKCLVLAGGRGERLWPLSRKNYPKQFIKVQKNHSLFQETIARNLPYCDEFIIITNYEYRYIIENQMAAFRGVPFRCVYEGEPRKTTAAITLACLSLQPSEYVFVVAAVHVIDILSESDDKKLSYKDSIVKGKELAGENKIILFGKENDTIDNRFGYVVDGRFYEKPDRKVSKTLVDKPLLQNLGMMLFQNGTMLNELKKNTSEVFNQCTEGYRNGTALSGGVLYEKSVLEAIEPIAIEKSVLEKTDNITCIPVNFSWSDIGQLEDLERTGFIAEGVGITHESQGSLIVNQSPHKAVVVNDLDNALVVNTTDAVYVGRRGKSDYLKTILHDNPELDNYSDYGTITYRSWGYYETVTEDEQYRVRRVTILPGRTIYEHKHEERKENWTIISGTVLVTLDGKTKTYYPSDNIDIPFNTPHQISNIDDMPAVLIETAVGDVLHGGDIQSSGSYKLTESDLGMRLGPIIKLSPAFKDYLWGGTKLRDIYGKQCDYDAIAESWELSAHPAGNSIVSSGRHKGMPFSKYLETVGKDVLGWKCMQDFPLLIKFIDAKDNLSIQVHPDDDYALENEHEYGKNEMWYVIDAEPGAGLYVGFNRDVDRDEVEKRVTDNTILDILNFYPTKPGDVFFIPAGTVHAIGAGNLICEIQQNSNSTYRLYDYDRRDKFGNPRELHLKKALDVLKYTKYEPEDLEKHDGKIRCKYFETSITEVDGKKTVPLIDDSFYSLVAIKGSGAISVDKENMDMSAGDSIFIPATNNTLTITGKLSLVITRI